jgi:tubulin alpha
MTGVCDTYSLKEHIQREAEHCSNLRGYIIFHSLDYEYEPMMIPKLMDVLSEEFGRRNIVNFPIYPSLWFAPSYVGAFHAVQSIHDILRYSDVAFMFEREAIDDICLHNFSNERPTNRDLNRLIAQVVSSITLSDRFPAESGINLAQLKDNLIQFPRLKFPLVSYAPFISADNAHLEQPSVAEITDAAFEASSQMIKCDRDSGWPMSFCLLYQGDASPLEVNKKIRMILADTTRFATQRAALNVGRNNQSPTLVPDSNMGNIPRAVCKVENTTSLSFVLGRLKSQIDRMYRRRAPFCQYFDEDISENEFLEACNDLHNLEMEYQAGGEGNEA